MCYLADPGDYQNTFERIVATASLAHICSDLPETYEDAASRYEIAVGEAAAEWDKRRGYPAIEVRPNGDLKILRDGFGAYIAVTDGQGALLAVARVERCMDLRARQIHCGLSPFYIHRRAAVD